MRLCFLTRDYALYPPYGGVATYVRDAAQWLAENGHEVQVVAVNRRRSAHTVQDGEVRVHFVEPRRIRPRSLVGLLARLLGLHALGEAYSGWDLLENSLGGWSAVDRLAREAPFDLVECDDYEGKALFGLWPRHRYRVVLRGHGIIHLDLPFAQYPGARFHHDLEAICADRADFILTAAEYLVGSYRNELPLRHNRIRSLALPMAVSEMARRHVRDGNTHGEAVVLYVGRFEHRKGTDVLFAALRDVRSRGWAVHCVLVGAPEADSAEQLGEFIAANTGWVTYAGPLPQSEVFEHMACADMLVLPSRTETLPRVLIEAQALGLPQIATRVGGIPEIVEDGVTGLLVDVGDAIGLADAVMTLCSDPQLRSNMAQASRVRALSRYDTDAIMREQEHVYRSVAAGRAPDVPPAAAQGGGYGVGTG